MRSIGKLIACLLLIVTVSSVQAQTKKAASWYDMVVTLRQNIEKGKIKGVKPYISGVKKQKEAPDQVVYDLKGVSEFVIDMGDSGNGNAWDYAAVGNPVLTDLSGKQVSLLDLTPCSTSGESGTPKFNTDLTGKRKIKIAGKAYDKGIMAHAEAQLVYKLDGKYKSLSVDLGIEDGTRIAASVVFALRDARMSRAALLKNCSAELIKSMNDFLYQSGTSFDELLFSPKDMLIEKVIAERVSKRRQTVTKKSYQAKIKNIASLPEKTQAAAYIKLAEEMLMMGLLNEKIQWVDAEALALYLDDMKSNDKFDYAANKAIYDEIAKDLAAVKAGITAGDVTFAPKAEAILALRDKLIFANPVLDTDIVVSRFNIGSTARKIMAPQLGTQSNNWSNQESAKRVGFNSSVAVLSDFKNGAKLRTVYAPTNGSPISDLRIHWDGDKAMFTGIQEDGRWNIFEADLKNGGAKKLMEIPESDLEFYDATYLPDGRIIATSNIGLQGVPCVNGSDPVGNMVLYTPKDNSFRRITFDQDANWNPSITHDGKVMYTRWEYTDLTHYYSRIVMTMNPDGTEQRALYGSGYMFPNSVFDMQVIPGHSSAFVGIISGHHGVARSGRLILFDPKKSRKGAAGMLQEIPYHDREIKEVVKDRLVDNVWPQFIKPTPIDDKYYLVAAKMSPESLWGVYLVDIFDNVTCLYEAEGEGFISPMAAQKTPTPPAIPDKVNLSDPEATVFIQDIYEGEGLPGVPRGAVKELRIFSYEYAYLKTKSDHN